LVNSIQVRKVIMRNHSRRHHSKEGKSNISSAFNAWPAQTIHSSFITKPRKHGSRFGKSQSQNDIGLSFQSDGNFSTDTQKTKNTADDPRYNSHQENINYHQSEGLESFHSRGSNSPHSQKTTREQVHQLSTFDERSITEKSGGSKPRTEYGYGERGGAKKQYDLRLKEPRYRQRLTIDQNNSEDRSDRNTIQPQGTALFQTIPNLHETCSNSQLSHQSPHQDQESLSREEESLRIKIEDKSVCSSISGVGSLVRSWSNDECSSTGSILGGGTALCEQVDHMKHHVKSLKGILVEKYHSVRYSELRVVELRKELKNLDCLRYEASKPLQKEYGIKKASISINDFFDFYSSKFLTSQSSVPSSRAVALTRYRDLTERMETVKNNLLVAETEAKVVHASVKKLKRDILGIAKCLKQIGNNRNQTIELYERDRKILQEQHELENKSAEREGSHENDLIEQLEEAENNIKRKDNLITRYESEVAGLKKEIIQREEETDKTIIDMQKELKRRLEEQEREAINKLKILQDRIQSMKEEHGIVLAKRDQKISNLIEENESIHQKAIAEKKEYLSRVKATNEDIFSQMGAAKDAAQAELVFSFQRLALINDMLSKANSIKEEADSELDLLQSGKQLPKKSPELKKDNGKKSKKKLKKKELFSSSTQEITQ